MPHHDLGARRNSREERNKIQRESSFYPKCSREAIHFTQGPARSAALPEIPPLTLPFSQGMETLRARAPRILCLVCILLLGLATLPAHATAPARPASILDDYQFQEQTRKGLGYLYNMDFAAADATFAEIAALHPDHPVSPFLEALVPWWTIQLEPSDTSEDAAFLASMERVLDISERRLDANPRDIDAMFFKAGAHAFRGRLHSDRKNWVRAARDGQPQA